MTEVPKININYTATKKRGEATVHTVGLGQKPKTSAMEIAIRTGRPVIRNGNVVTVSSTPPKPAGK